MADDVVEVTDVWQRAKVGNLGGICSHLVYEATGMRVKGEYMRLTEDFKMALSSWTMLEPT